MVEELSAAELGRELKVSTRAVQAWIEEGLPATPAGKYDLLVAIFWVTGHRKSKRARFAVLSLSAPVKIAMGWLEGPTGDRARKDDLAVYFDTMARAGVGALESRDALFMAIGLYQAANITYPKGLE